MFKCYCVMACLHLLLLVWPLSVALCLIFKPPRSLHQKVSSRQERSEYFFDLCSDWTQISSSSPHSVSHPTGSISRQGSSWLEDVLGKLPVWHPGLLLQTWTDFRVWQVYTSLSPPSVFQLFTIGLCFQAWAATLILEVWCFLIVIISPQSSMWRKSKHWCLYFESCSSCSCSHSLIFYTPWLDFAPLVSMTTQLEGFDGEWAS